MSADPTTAGGFQPIVEMLEAAEEIAQRLGVTDPVTLDAFRRQVLMSLSGAYMEACATTLESPDWVPYIPYYLPRSGPNPDSIYRFAPIDPQGVYRLSGMDGTDIIATVTMRKGGAHLGRRCAARVGEVDLKKVPRDADGRFSFILSATRPPGETGAWFELHPETECLMSRHVTKDAGQTEGFCGLERLDRPAGDLAPQAGEVRGVMERMASYVLSQVEFLPTYLSQLRGRGAAEGFILDDQTEYGGLVSQLYHYYLFDLQPGEAIVLESDVPDACEYWSVQLMDPLARTIDYVLHQSSLNDVQAIVDADRRTRCVIALEDPGVANWLDPAGWRNGVVLWRWASPSSTPTPTVRRVRLEELKAALPAETTEVAVAARRALMRERADFYQARRR